MTDGLKNALFIANNALSHRPENLYSNWYNPDPHGLTIRLQQIEGRAKGYQRSLCALGARYRHPPV